MSTRAELEAVLNSARTARDLGNAEDARAEAERDRIRCEWAKARDNYYKAGNDREMVRTVIDKASPECEKVRAAWITARAQWDKIDGEYSRIHAEDSKTIEQQRKSRVERDAAYNAAVDALDELDHATTARLKEIKAVFDQASAARDLASARWEKAKVEWNEARAEWEREIEDWEKVQADWEKARADLDAVKRLHGDESTIDLPAPNGPPPIAPAAQSPDTGDTG